MLKRLQPRLYSISSSPLPDPHQVRLTVSVVRFDNLRGQPRKGVCSTFLADADPSATVPVFVQRVAALPAAGRPRHPDDHGRARHRRRAVPRLPAGAPGPRPPAAELAVLRRAAPGHRLLLRGRARRDAQPTAAQPARPGVLPRPARTRSTSRTGCASTAPQLWSWLQDGAHFYVCGDASRMAKDVDRALRDIAVAHGHLTHDEADGVRQAARGRQAVRARRLLTEPTSPSWIAAGAGIVSPAPDGPKQGGNPNFLPSVRPISRVRTKDR